MTIKPRLGQSNIDLSIQSLGSIDSIVNFCNENNVTDLDVLADSYSFTDGEILNKNNTGIQYSTQNKNIVNSSSCDSITGLAFNLSTLIVSWDASLGLGYEYWISRSNAIPTGSGNFTESNSISISFLSDGSVYYFFIRKVCSLSNKGNISNLEIDYPPAIPSISGLIAEYFASYGVPLSGGQFHKWLDISGQGNTMHTLIGSNPAIVPNSIGSEPTIYFDGTNAIQTIVSLNGVLATQALTIFAVFKYANSPASKCWLDYSNGNYFLITDGFGSYFYNGHGDVLLLLKGNVGVSGGHMAAINDSPFVFTLIPDKFQAYGLEIDILKKNSTTGFVVSSSSENTNAFGNYKLTIGSDFTGGQNAILNIGCLLVYNRRLTTLEQTSVYNYLKTKYSL